MVVLVGASRRPSSQLRALDTALGGEIAARQDLGELGIDGGGPASIPGLDRVGAARLVVVASGADATPDQVRGAAAAAGRAVARNGAEHVAIWVEHASDTDTDTDTGIDTDALPGPDRHVVLGLVTEGFLLGAHRVRSYARDDDRPAVPDRLTVLVSDQADHEASERAAQEAAIVAESVGWSRDLVDAPPNRLTPVALAEAAAAAGREAGMRVTVHDEAWMETQGMGALLAVAQGSANPPRIVVLEHRPGESELPSVAWVGKGVTFDSGGLSLKDRTSMPDMKGDMAGAAAVLGAALAVARMDLPVRMVTVAVCVENMPDGGAYRPADVVIAGDGTAIEIVSTDAEGRLALADALLLAQRFGTDVVADVATLTGGAIVALGKGTAAAAFATDDRWLDTLKEAARSSGDAIWPMPIYDDYLRAIASRVADLKNGGVREGSAGIGAVFLRRFAPPRWAHLDIAGVAWTDEPKGVWNAGATGFGVRLAVDATRRLASDA
ncbi:MAG: hypothetical protein U5J97_00995 [Trueperaceae bacterium]|nr:hypothetical protein [Trueperaceae bacterium]